MDNLLYKTIRSLVLLTILILTLHSVQYDYLRYLQIKYKVLKKTLMMIMTMMMVIMTMMFIDIFIKIVITIYLYSTVSQLAPFARKMALHWAAYTLVK